MRALLLAGLVVLAGCVAAPPASDSPTEPTTGTTAVPSPEGPCEIGPRPDPEPGADEVDAVDYPEAPSSFTTQRVRSYVRSFEERYVHNDALVKYGNVTYLETYVEGVSVTRHGDAFVVRLESYTNGGTLDQRGEETPFQIHWDGAPEPVTYLVTEDRVIRGDGNLTLDRLRHHPTVACV